MPSRSIITALAAALMAFGASGGAIPASAAPAHQTSYAAATGLPGLDAGPSSGEIDWAGDKAKGAAFAYIEATEGTSFTSSQFAHQMAGATAAGLIAGAYHFATPNTSTGAAQADYFVAHGGGWSADHQTLPGTVDLEVNPAGATCYGLSQASMVSWITSFVNEYRAKTGRWPVIYTTVSWWSTCAGNSAAFGANDPLFIASFSANPPGTLPAGWSTWTFWQHEDLGAFPGDTDTFNGTLKDLQALADNT